MLSAGKVVYLGLFVLKPIDPLNPQISTVLFVHWKQWIGYITLHGQSF